MDKTNELLKELTEAFGPTGCERAVRNIMRRELEPLASHIEQDGLGSLIATLPGSSDRPRILLDGHMDEVGFLVRYITDGGFLRFQPLGGWWDQVLLAHEVIIRTRKGDVLGVIGSNSPRWMKDSERNTVMAKDSMFIDVGVTTRKEVEELGIRVGDPIVPKAEFAVMGNGKALLSKAFDDRVGCALIVDVFKAFAKQPHPNTIFGVGAVQEEVGMRGAHTAAFAVNPDVAFALEVGLAGDLPDTSPSQCSAKLGGGVEIVSYDASMVPNSALRDFAFDTAQELDIPVQMDMIPAGGTDGSPIHLNAHGVPTLVIGVPTRHIHSHYGILYREDYDSAVRLLVEMIKRLDTEMLEKIKA
jgi:putative aminopeptidase FrvX